MTLPDVTRIERYWGHTPPLRDIVAAFAGVKDGASRDKTSDQAMTAEEALPEFEE